MAILRFGGGSIPDAPGLAAWDSRMETSGDYFAAPDVQDKVFPADNRAPISIKTYIKQLLDQATGC